MADPERKEPEGVKMLLGELLKTVAGILLATLSGLKGLALADLEGDLSGLHQDMRFGLNHYGVVMARRFAWFQEFWVVAMTIHLIAVLFAEKLVLATPLSVFALIVFQAAYVLLQIWAHPVKSAGFFDHRKQRLLVVAAQKRLAELRILRDAPNAGADVLAAYSAQEQDFAEIQRSYHRWLESQGAHDRTPLTVAGLSTVFTILSGFALTYGVVGSHDGGPYTYDQVFWHVVEGCILPVPLFLLPLAVIILMSPFLFNRAASVEDVFTFLRLELKAFAVIGQGFPEIEKGARADAAANGDQPQRNASTVSKQHVLEFLASTGLSVLGAMALLIRHCLFFPSGVAFIWSLFFRLASWFMEKRQEKYNILKEEQRQWPSRVLSALAVLIYFHMWFAGGAPKGFRGLNYWWSDYGPFADTIGPTEVGANYDAVRDTTHSVTRPSGEVVSQLWGLDFPSACVFAFVVFAVMLILFLFWRPVSEQLDKIAKGHILIKWIAIPVAGCLTLALTIALLGATRHSLADLGHENAATSSRASTSSTRISSCDLINGRFPCTPECLRAANLLPTPSGIEQARGQGRCY